MTVYCIKILERYGCNTPKKPHHSKVENSIDIGDATLFGYRDIQGRYPFFTSLTKPATSTTTTSAQQTPSPMDKATSLSAWHTPPLVKDAKMQRCKDDWRVSDPLLPIIPALTN